MVYYRTPWYHDIWLYIMTFIIYRAIYYWLYIMLFIIYHAIYYISWYLIYISDVHIWRPIVVQVGSQQYVKVCKVGKSTPTVLHQARKTFQAQIKVIHGSESLGWEHRPSNYGFLLYWYQSRITQIEILHLYVVPHSLIAFSLLLFVLYMSCRAGNLSSIYSVTDS